MQKLIKAGILIALLVVPAFVFLFLKAFGTNRYSLRTYYPRVDSTTGEPIIRKRVEYRREVNDTLFHQVPDFALTDQNGRGVTGAITGGKVSIVSFLFTRCLGVCPKTSAQMSRVQDLFLNNPDVVLLSYSVDPAHDQPPVLREYAATYGAKPGKWFFLTGDKEAIYRLVREGYKLPATDTGKQTQSLEDEFIHSERLVLVDKDRHIRGYYNGIDPEEIDRLVLETRILLDMDGQQTK
ncbi:MAG: SCO family protein [Ferruginibacter sp.]|nr:SCO family protein [Cytophagales bacterium]